MHRLLNFLLYKLLFAGTMFFAAGAPALGDAGAAGGGDASEGGAVGDDSGSGQPSSDVSPGAEEGNEGNAEDVGDTDGQADPNSLVDSGDGRKIPQKYQELFKGDKSLKEMYFSAQALKRSFPGGVKEAVELAKNLETLGGLDGIEQIQSENQSYKADSELFLKDQAKWIESAFAENADASLKAFQHSLDYVGEHHPEQYDHLMAKVILNDLGSLPVREIHGILAGLKDNPQAQDLASKLAKYYNDRDALAKNVPEKKFDAKEKALQERDATLTTKAQELRNKTINLEAAPYLTKAVDSSIDAEAKAAGFDIAKIRNEQPKRYAKFVQDVKNTIFSKVKDDEKWLGRYSAALAANETSKCVRMVNSRHDQAINGNGREPGVVAGLFTEWFGTGKAKPAATPGQQRQAAPGARPSTGSETPMVVNALPSPKDINYSDPKTDKWEGIYRLRTGKLIQVKRT